MTDRFFKLTCLVLLFASFSSLPQHALAQQSAPGAPAQTATITGAVVDPNGRPIANAQVKLTGPSRGQTQTDYRGLYTFTNINLGTYEIEVTATGYGTVTRSDILVAGDTTVDVHYLSQASNLRVIARAATNAQASINVTPASVSPLSPSNYAFQGVTSWRQILEQIPGVAATGQTYGGGDTNDVIPNGPFQPIVLSINGAQPYETATLLDGMPFINQSFSASAGDGADLGTVPLIAFDSAEVVRGPGADSPSILNSIGGSFVLHAPTPVTQNSYQLSYSNDPYGGFSSNAKVALHLGRLSTMFAFGLNDSPGPITRGVIEAAGLDEFAKIDGQNFSCPSIGPVPSSWLNFGCLIYRNPANIQPWYSAWAVTGVFCCTQANTGWDVHYGSGMLSYQIGSDVTAEVFYSGDLSRALQTGWIYPDELYTPIPGYTGSVSPGMHTFVDVLYNSPEIQADSALEEKITVNVGRGTFQAAALQNNSNVRQLLGFTPEGSYEAYGELCLGTATGPTPTPAGSCPPGTTPTIFNGQSVYAASEEGIYGEYNDSSHTSNRDLSFRYETQLGSSTTAGVSFVKAYYNNYANYGYAAFGLSTEPDSESLTSNETRLHIGTELSDKLNVDASWYFAEGTYHVPNPADTTQNLQYPSSWVDAVYPYNAPRLGLVWRASQDIAVRAAAGGGFALPPLYQLIGTNGSPSCSSASCGVTLTNVNLKPEQSFGLDIGTDVRFNSSTSVSLDLYQTNLYGQIFEASLVTGTFNNLPLVTTQYQNLAHTRMEGINLSFQHNVPHGIWWHGAFGLTRAYVVNLPAGFYNLGTAVCTPAAPANCTNTEIIPGVNFTGAGYSGIAAVPYAGGYAGLGYRWTPSKYVEVEADYFGKNNSYYEPPFVALNGYASYGITKNVTLLATFQNLTGIYDGNYEMFQNYPTLIAPASPGALPYGLDSLPYGPRAVILTANFRY